jgi:phosphoglycerate kinase
MKSVRDVKILQNIPVIVRAALNEPVANGVVGDSFRLARALPTLRYLQSRGARVVVISHIGEAGTETLAPVAKKLGEMITHVSFCDQTIGSKAREAVRKLAPGELLVMENLRRNRGEVMNDLTFAKELAHLGDVFVEDSFDTCHRKHASIVTLPTLLPSYAGLLLEQEVAELTKALSPKSPSFAIIAGAKFSTKESVLDALLKSYDKLFIGGALANDFLLAAGHPVGSSLTSGADAAVIRKLLNNPKLVLPIDSRLGKKGTLASSARVAGLDDVATDEMILDHGPGTEALLASIVGKSAQILWNGPLGNYEDGYTQSTDALAHAIAASSAYSVIGGGDTIAAIEALNVLDRFSFVSTGGGAMLDFLADGTLPGIKVLDT